MGNFGNGGLGSSGEWHKVVHRIKRYRAVESGRLRLRLVESGGVLYYYRVVL